MADRDHPVEECEKIKGYSLTVGMRKTTFRVPYQDLAVSRFCGRTALPPGT